MDMCACVRASLCKMTGARQLVSSLWTGAATAEWQCGFLSQSKCVWTVCVCGRCVCARARACSSTRVSVRPYGHKCKHVCTLAAARDNVVLYVDGVGQKPNSQGHSSSASSCPVPTPPTLTPGGGAMRFESQSFIRWAPFLNARILCFHSNTHKVGWNEERTNKNRVMKRWHCLFYIFKH